MRVLISARSSQHEWKRPSQPSPPGRLVMHSALVFDPHQVPSAFIALRHEQVAHLSRVRQRSLAFACSHVQVYATANVSRCLYQAEDLAVTEPERGAHGRDEPITS